VTFSSMEHHSIDTSHQKLLRRGLKRVCVHCRHWLMQMDTLPADALTMELTQILVCTFCCGRTY